MSGDARPRARRRRRPRELGAPQLLAIGRTVLIAVGLTLLTIVVFTLMPRYALPGDPVIANADFREGFAGWEVRGIVSLDETEIGLATLQNRNPEDAVFLRKTIRVPSGRTALLLSADVATYGVRRGEERWQTARIYLVQIAPDGSMLWNQPNRLVELVGTSVRHHVEQIFEISSTIDEVMLGIELPFATGRFQVANLRLALLDERPSFRLAASILVAAWCLLVAWVGWRLMNSLGTPRTRTALVLSLAVLMLGVFMPSTVRQALIDHLASGFGLDFAEPDALGHSLVFMLLALVVRSGRPHDPVLLHLSCWLLVGAITEVLQLFTVDRDPEITDWLADVIGTVIGLATAELVLWLERIFGPPKKAKPRAPPSS